ncbi:MAG: hypothetical protein K2Y20_07835 [Sphingomonas sp.]|nr:hypothetical protein [Sphingomonas sp.]
MVTLTKAARAAILLIGAAAIAMPIAAPAKEKKKEEAAPAGPQLSPEFRKVAVPADMALRAIADKQRASITTDVSADLAAAEPLVAAAEAAAKTEDDNYYKLSFRLKIEDLKAQAAAKGDVAIYRQKEGALIEPLKALIAHPRASAPERALYLNRLGEHAYDVKDYAGALTYFQQAKAAGSTASNLGLNIVRAKTEGGDIVGGIAEMKALIAAERAAGRTPPEAWYLYPRAKANGAKLTAEFLDLTKLWLGAYPTAKNWRDALVYYGFQGPYKLDKRERIDIFRLLRLAKSLGDQNDYAEYAQNLFDVGLPEEAKAVIEEGRAAGKVPAAGGPNAMIMTDAVAAIKAEGPLDALAKKAAAAPNGVLAAATGDGYLGSDDYAHAIELYTLALKKGGVAKPEEVLTHMGIAQARAGDKAGAKATFAMIKSPPRADIASFWILWLDSAPAA